MYKFKFKNILKKEFFLLPNNIKLLFKWEYI